MLGKVFQSGQQILQSYSQNVELSLPHSEKPLTIKQAVYYLMDWEADLRVREAAFDKEKLWRLTHRVGALLGKPVNPETVARCRRRYWNNEV